MLPLPPSHEGYKMARLRTYSSIDMTDFRTRIGWPTYADEDAILISIGNDDIKNFGSFAI
jgi:hypothetical protein